MEKVLIGIYWVMFACFYCLFGVFINWRKLKEMKRIALLKSAKSKKPSSFLFLHYSIIYVLLVSVATVNVFAWIYLLK